MSGSGKRWLSRAEHAKRKGKATARLGAVQALYQEEMDGTPLAKLLNEFHQHRLGAEIEDVQYADANIDLFDDIVKGALARRDEIDTVIAGSLPEGWAVDRLDRPLRQILRCGTYEMIARIDIPTNAIVSEYVDLADAFGGGPEKAFVNGVLAAIGRNTRGGA